MPKMTDIQCYSMFFIISFVSTLVIRSFSKKTNRTHFHLPPGPRPLPIIGHLQLITFPLDQFYQKLSTKYGPIIYLQFGASKQIIISSASLATEIFKTQDLAFASRPPFAVEDRLTFIASSFLYSEYGEYWKFMKKLCMTKLLSPQALEASSGVRRQGLRSFLQKIVESASLLKPVDVGLELLKLTNNIICTMAMNTNCSSNDDEAEKCRKLVQETFEQALKLTIGDVLGPFKWLGFWIYGKQAVNLERRFDGMVENILKQHEEKREENSKTSQYKDLIDVLLEMHYDNQAEFKLTRTQIKSFLLDIFVAGTDTSANTMQWTLAELINHPKVFKKVREEIDSLVGNSRLVEESDISSLPYLQAVMKEILRLHPLGSLIPRKCREHCKLDGFDIPKNTTILINTYAAMRDPNLWDDPNEFKPERFLISKDTEKTLARQDQMEGQLLDLLTFGGGRRRCPGMMLAFHTMSPTVAAMVQCFDWTPIEEGREVDVVNMEVRKGLNHVMEQSLVCTPRVRLNPLDCIA
ncbi:unnamed protein product [Coffea canephora]|uniref:Cytochrome P450 n=1 Tax=Coffea canephora TaxID=49390 RepID=A0A068URB9_COFCA|nr:unnamed protein product [Coffea canephora]